MPTKLTGCVIKDQARLMKFCSKLTEATLLKRSIKFLVEAALLDKQRIMLRCPNLGRLLGCDILGTKLWFSNPIGYHCLPTWELAEVDGGHLVCVNPEYILSLVLDGIKAKVITELADCIILHSSSKLQYPRYHNLLVQRNNRQCYVAIEHVTLGNEDGDGYFPDIKHGGIENLEYLTKLCLAGHQAMLLYCVMHTGINKVSLAVHIDPQYMEKLNIALSTGVEVVAYNTKISLHGLEVSGRVPVECVGLGMQERVHKQNEN